MHQRPSQGPSKTFEYQPSDYCSFLKPSSFVINTARAGIINQEDLNKFSILDNFEKLTARYEYWTKFKFNEEFEDQCNNLIENFFNKKTIKIANKSIQNKTNIYKELDYSAIKNSENLDQAINSLFENIQSSAYYEIKETHEFVMILPKKYYQPGSYNNWIRVCWALKNTDSRLFLTWLKFSSQSEEFIWNQVENLYEK